MSCDFLCEEKLSRLNPSLHQRYCSSLFASEKILTSYRAIFPDYTDHSFLHTMNVLNYCNELIGSDLEALNCGEIYTLMMAASLHDTGMGISENDYKEFISRKRFEDYLSRNKSTPKEEIIRHFHHELSGCFIYKYSLLFEIPDEFVFPVIQTARGHRVTDLYDETEYPKKYRAGEYFLCLPYLAAVLRLADELDISAERNILLDRNISEIKNSYSLSVWRLHSAVKEVRLEERKCIVRTEPLSEDDEKELKNWLTKLEYVFGYTSDVVHRQTPYELRKRKVVREYV
jgi:hypothetical protein